ncbi:unnamed protein product, partial [Brassica napus]
QVNHSASGISSSGLSGVGVVQLSHLVVKCAPVLRQIGGESWVVHAVGHGALLSSARVNELSVCSKLSSMAACGQNGEAVLGLSFPPCCLRLVLLTSQDRFNFLSLVVATVAGTCSIWDAFHVSLAFHTSRLWWHLQGWGKYSKTSPIVVPSFVDSEGISFVEFIGNYLLRRHQGNFRHPRQRGEPHVPENRVDG